MRGRVHQWIASVLGRLTIPTGPDLRQTKIVISDLRRNNKRRHTPFEVPTDSDRPLRGRDLVQIGIALRQEVIAALATRQPTRPTNTYAVDVRPGVPTQLPGEEDERVVVVECAGDGAVRDLLLSRAGSRSLSVSALTSAKTTDRGSVERLFEDFIRTRTEGASPFGLDYELSLEELVLFFGYGQCHNQSLALCDLLSRTRLESRVVHKSSPKPHTVVEATVEDRPLLMDPLFRFTVDAAARDVFSEPAKHLGSAPLPPATLDAALPFYEGGTVSEEYPQRRPPLERPGTPVHPDHPVTWHFPDHSHSFPPFPWISGRNVEPPPPGTLGFIRFNASGAVPCGWPIAEIETEGFRDLPTSSGRYALHYAEDSPATITAQFSQIRHYLRGDAQISLEAAGGPFRVTVGTVSLPRMNDDPLAEEKSPPARGSVHRASDSE